MFFKRRWRSNCTGDRTTDDVKHDRVATMVSNLSVCAISRICGSAKFAAGKVPYGIRGHERMLMLMGNTTQRDYGVFA